MVKRAVYDALNGDEPFDFENKRGQVFSALSAKDTDITTDKHTRYTFRTLTDWFANIYLTYLSVTGVRF